MLHYMYDLCIPDLTSPCVSLVLTHVSYDMSDVIHVLRWYTHTYTCTCNNLVGNFDQNCCKILRSDTQYTILQQRTQLTQLRITSYISWKVVGLLTMLLQVLGESYQGMVMRDGSQISALLPYGFQVSKYKPVHDFHVQEPSIHV